MKKATLFKNISVITPTTNGVKHFKDYFVAVRDKKYAYVGSDFNKATQSLEGLDYSVYDGKDKILMPCFANAHTHLTMTLMRNRADDETLHNWLFNTIFPLEENLRPEDLNAGTELAIVEMIKSGTGACANMYIVEEGAFDADVAGKAGIKLNTVINGGFKNDATGNFVIDEKYFKYIFDKFNNSFDRTIKCGVLVHSIYLYNEEFLYQLAKLASDNNTFIHTHLSESEKEINDCVAKYGLRPPHMMKKMGLFSVPIIAAHCVYINEEEIKMLSELENFTAVHNPSSNLKLGSGMADIIALSDGGVNVAIGTDGAASNNNLDMYNEIRLASFLAKGIYKDASAINAEKILEMSTINGMKGLGFEHSGKVEEGFFADLQIINTDTYNMTPLGDAISAVCYSMNSSNVESLMVNGNMLMKNRELLTIDEERAKFNAKKSAEYLFNKVAKPKTII